MTEFRFRMEPPDTEGIEKGLANGGSLTLPKFLMTWFGI